MTNEKLYENCKIVKLYEKKTAPLIDKIRMKKRNPIQSCIVRYSNKFMTRNCQNATQSRIRLLGPLRGNKN